VRPLWWALALLIFWGGKAAAEPAAVLLRGVRVVDARGDQGTHDLLIAEGRIAALDPAEIPEGTQVLDAKGKTVVPGLVDSHLHVTMAPAQAFRKESDEALWTRHATHLRALLAWGVTTVVDPGITLDNAKRIRALQARSPSPEVIFVGPILGPTGGYPAAVVPEFPGLSSRAQLVKQLDAFMVVKPVGVKVTMEQGVFYKIWPLHTLEMRAAIMEEAGRRELPLYVHAMSPEMTRLALTMKPHALMHAPQQGDDRLVDEVARSGAYVVSTLDIVGAGRLMWHPEDLDDPRIALTVPQDEIDAARSPEIREAFADAFGRTLAPGMPGWVRWLGKRLTFTERYFQSRYRRARDVISQLHKAGVPVVVGSDSAGWPIFPYLLHGRSTHVEMGLLRDAGLTPAEVLTAATLRPARMLGMEAEIGTVEVGKRADLLVVSGDPLEDVGALGHPVWVIRAGEVRTPHGWMSDL
jgi:imidazolonepropionase-like amidohydrolase